MTDSTVSTYSIYCRNCGHGMEPGGFCPRCGQEDKEVLRPFLFFLQELLRVVLELDGRAYRTIFFLITRPGFLTKQYFEGRRVSYTPPLRLFLIVSIGFFLIVSVVSTMQGFRESMLEAQSAQATEAVADEELPAETETDPGSGDDLEFETGPTEFNSNVDEDFADALELIEGIQLPFLDAEANENLQELLTAQMRSNLEELTDDPRDFIAGSLEYVTFFMLLMMPILALIQQIMLVLCRRYYVEHLVLTVHNHAFLILMIFITMMFGLFENIQFAYIGWVADALSVVGAIWIGVYLFLSMKRYFGLKWYTASLAFFTSTIIYAAVLGSGLFVFGLLVVLFS